jgi:hypothetical protein
MILVLKILIKIILTVIYERTHDFNNQNVTNKYISVLKKLLN